MGFSPIKLPVILWSIKLVKLLFAYKETVIFLTPSLSLNVPTVVSIVVSVFFTNIGAVTVVIWSTMIKEFVSKILSTLNLSLSLFSPFTTYILRLTVVFVSGCKAVIVTFSSKLITLSENFSLYCVPFTVTIAGKISVFLIPSSSLQLIFPVALSECIVPTCENVQVVMLLSSEPELESESLFPEPPQPFKITTKIKIKIFFNRFFIIYSLYNWYIIVYFN